MLRNVVSFCSVAGPISELGMGIQLVLYLYLAPSHQRRSSDLRLRDGHSPIIQRKSAHWRILIVVVRLVLTTSWSSSGIFFLPARIDNTRQTVDDVLVIDWQMQLEFVTPNQLGRINVIDVVLEVPLRLKHNNILIERRFIERRFLSLSSGRRYLRHQSTPSLSSIDAILVID